MPNGTAHVSVDHAKYTVISVADILGIDWKSIDVQTDGRGRVVKISLTPQQMDDLLALGSDLGR